MNYIYHSYDFNGVESAVLLMMSAYNDSDDHNDLADNLNLESPDEDMPREGSWGDEDDEDFDDETETRNDLHEIQVDDDLGEPNPEEDDHLPEEELQ
ncbi:hypothetical protein ACFQZX_11960 [Mucilaginibacter litoreus]|uniref:Uncharacterized protein n=1 Tax=Mucilaginibacter litoreus TaxID=1048221 RepID=A0ABW3AU41_9SPHI